MRLDGIDILRGIAVIAVIIYHFFVLLGLTHHTFFPYVKNFGSLGVPLFFIISGYLIYRSIEKNIEHKNPTKGLINYFLHRLFRILPAYYFNLLIVVLIASFVITPNYFYSASFFKQIFTNLIFSSYFIHKSAGFEINGAYWTLGIEMIWYIIAPLFFIYFKRFPILLFIILLSFLYIWGLSIGYFDAFFDLNNTATNYRLLIHYYASLLPGQITYFISGILIYKYALSFDRDKIIHNYLLSITLLILFTTIMGYYNIHLNFLPSHLLHLIVTSILFILIYRTKIKGLGLIEWIGKISYSLYLWHMPILYIMNKSHILGYRSMFDTTLFFLILLFSISAMSYYFIEEGGFTLRKKLKNKLEKRSIL